MNMNQNAASTSSEAEVLNVHRAYLNCLFMPSENSETILRKYTSDDITYYGTGRDEHGSTLENWVSLNLRAIQQLPEGISYVEKDFRCRMYDSLAVVEADIIIIFPSDLKPIELVSRFTAIYEQRSDTWKAVHIHVSLPSSEQADGEAWPIETIQAKYRELEEVVAERTAELKQSLENLKAAQQQLVHAAKMASLGELTAGIAHEIQNPLNFVTNFSDVNKELITDLKTELQNGNVKEAITIANVVEENEQKIAHHSKRADSIVKNMLQHSRKTTGEKELVNLNAIVDEYLRLSYHGFRAKNKTFNPALKTDFDEIIGNVEVIPEELGRALLNLFNNAFYSLLEKKKQLNHNYLPVITVSTKQHNRVVEITVCDNGTGIPESVVDKIFQPFFTTKPAGEGSGLGLSMSYDIIKAHGGELQVNTKEGEGAEFVISLPHK